MIDDECQEWEAQARMAQQELVELLGDLKNFQDEMADPRRGPTVFRMDVAKRLNTIRGK